MRLGEVAAIWPGIESLEAILRAKGNFYVTLSCNLYLVSPPQTIQLSAIQQTEQFIAIHVPVSPFLVLTYLHQTPLRFYVQNFYCCTHVGHSSTEVQAAKARAVVAAEPAFNGRFSNMGTADPTSFEQLYNLLVKKIVEL